MKPFVCDKKNDTPQIIFKPEADEFKIKGRSLPENAEAFYQPVLNWMEAYLAEEPAEISLTIDLEYFNSSSVKQLLNLLILLESQVVNDRKVLIIWCYDEEDELMEMKGRELESIVNLPFRLEAYSL